MPYSGSCLCGGVSFQVEGQLEPIQICHCSQCRKAQGTPFATNIPVATSAFSLLSGESLLRTFESSPGKERVFCSQCGSPILSRRRDKPYVVRLRAGLIDGTLGIKPDAHAYVGSRAEWWSITDELPTYEGARPPGGR